MKVWVEASTKSKECTSLMQKIKVILNHKKFVIFKECANALCNAISLLFSQKTFRTQKMYRWNNKTLFSAGIMKFFLSSKIYQSFCVGLFLWIAKIRHKPDYCLRYFKSNQYAVIKIKFLFVWFSAQNKYLKIAICTPRLWYCSQ